MLTSKILYDILDTPPLVNWMPQLRQVVVVAYMPEPIVDWMTERWKWERAELMDQLGYIVKRIPPDLVEVRVPYPKRLISGRAHTETYLLKDIRPIPMAYQEDIERYVGLPLELRLSNERRY